MALFAFDMERVACGMSWKSLEYKLTMYKVALVIRVFLFPGADGAAAEGARPSLPDALHL